MTPEWVKVGDTLWAGEFWYTDESAWDRWTDTVVEQIDERGAWFLVGWTSADDRLVIDVLRRDIDIFLHDRNIRGVEFWRGNS